MRFECWAASGTGISHSTTQNSQLRTQNPDRTPRYTARMEYKHLGRTGLKVSPLCLGTMNFGPQTTEPDSFAIMDRAVAEGINFFDTADVYGGKKGEGLTERIVGRWFAQGGERREKTILATKVIRRHAAGRPAEHQPRLRPVGPQDRQAVRGVARKASKPTTSICTKCTTSTASARSTRSGRRSRR